MDGKTLQLVMLYDFFGEMLTDKQREYFELYYNEDLSLSEIAEKAGISKQGVHDMIVRAEKTLAETERRTGVVKRFTELQTQIERAEALTGALFPFVTGDEGAVIYEKLVSALSEMKG